MPVPAAAVVVGNPPPALPHRACAAACHDVRWRAEVYSGGSIAYFDLTEQHT
jgi:hypothetical protein